MTNVIRAPWTPEQVAALNDFQHGGWMHPFTCGGEHTPGSPVLIAREDGWHCSDPYGEGCDYVQDWAHAFMADRTRWPQRCSCGGHFPTWHLHADVHQPVEQSARTTPNNSVTSSDAAGNPLCKQVTDAVDGVFEQWMEGLDGQRPQDAVTAAVMAALERHLDIGEEQAWCKACRRVWEGRSHRCESDVENRLAALKQAHVALAAQAGRNQAAIGRVQALYEQWVKAGPPPLGVLIARWWDKRLVELRNAAFPPVDQQEAP